MADDIKSVVVARPDDGVRNSYAVTGGQDAPNLVVQALSPLRVIAIRTARVYVQSVLGFLSTGITGLDAGLMPHEFAARVKVAALLSLSIAGMTAGQNFLELLGKLDQKYPELRA